MTKTFKGASMAAVALSLLAPAVAGSLTDRDTKEVGDYVLTDAELAKYKQAVRRLEPLAELR